MKGQIVVEIPLKEIYMTLEMLKKAVSDIRGRVAELAAKVEVSKATSKITEADLDSLGAELALLDHDVRETVVNW